MVNQNVTQSQCHQVCDVSPTSLWLQQYFEEVIGLILNF